MGTDLIHQGPDRRCDDGTEPCNSIKDKELPI